MEAVDLNYPSKDTKVRSLAEHTTFCSSIRITQYGNSPEEVQQKYNDAVCHDRLIGEPIIECTGNKTQWRATWREKPNLEPSGKDSWWTRNRDKKGK